MAVQSGIGLSKILVLVGAGYTGTILVKNGKMSDVLGEIQALVKRFEKSGDHYDEDPDGMTTQMKRLAMEIRQLGSARQITVVNGGQGADYTPFIVPAATLGALGYGYMWFKGISFSDIMCITKRNMENAVANLTKHLDSVSEAISSARKHLSQRLQKVDDKLDLQKELLKGVHENVGLALEDLGKIGDDFDAMHSIFGGMGGKLDSIEYKQNIANMGLMYLCTSMGGENFSLPEIMIQEKLRLSGKSKTSKILSNEEASGSMALKENEKLELLEDC